MHDQLPQGWEVRSLAATAALCATGYWGEDQGGPDLLPARVIRNGDVGEDRIRSALPTRFFTPKQIERARVAPGDAILVSSGNVGRIARVGAADANPVTVASNFVRLVRAGPTATGDFLGHLLASSIVQQQLANHVAGSAIKNLHGSAYEEVMLPLPPLAEQRKIAAILSSVDETIEKTEAVIEQLDVVKKAMLEELLTRGIPGRHSRFKQTEIGEVPETWRLAPIGNVATVDTGFAYKSTDFVVAGSGTPIVRMSNLAEGILDLSDAKRIPEDVAKSTPRFALAAGDFLVGLSGSLTNHAWVRDSDLPCYLNQRVGRLRARECDPTFLAYSYLAPRTQAAVSLSAGGSSIANLSPNDLRAFQIALPELEEQRTIGKTISAVQETLLSSKTEVAELRRFKAVLAEQILSGSLRVAEAGVRS